MAEIFITDWASYNDGTQFQYAKYWDLSEFGDEEEFLLKIEDYFKNADEESPLKCGSSREEFFVSDFEIDEEEEPIRNLFHEGFLYDGIQKYYEFHQLEEGDKLKICAYLIEYGNNTSFTEMLELTENWHLSEVPEKYKFLPDGEKVGYYLIDELGYLEVPENLQYYFDYEKYGNECLLQETSLIEINNEEYILEK